MSTDYSALLTSQYSAQPNFLATVKLTANGIADITALLQSLPGLFDFDGAIGNQQDIDGQWIGFARTIGGVLLVQFFGFADDTSALGFGELTDPSAGGRFYELNADTSTTATLQDPEYRTLLRAKLLQNFWDGSVAQLESAIATIIKQPTTIIDPGTWVVLIMPAGAVDPVLQQLLLAYDLLPRVAGVRYQYVFPTATPYNWSTAGTVTAAANSLSKSTGVSAWDSSAYVASPSGAAYVAWTVPSTTQDMMGGLATNPSGSPNYPSLTAGLYAAAGGAFYVYESGIQQGSSFGTYAPRDSFAVYYDKKEVVYLHNGAPFKTTLMAPGALSPMFCLNTVGAQVQNIQISTGS